MAGAALVRALELTVFLSDCLPCFFMCGRQLIALFMLRELAFEAVDPHLLKFRRNPTRHL